jgi:hypothetical protein
VSRLSRQCGILNISQPYRPPRPVTGITLLALHPGLFPSDLWLKSCPSCMLNVWPNSPPVMIIPFLFLCKSAQAMELLIVHHHSRFLKYKYNLYKEWKMFTSFRSLTTSIHMQVLCCNKSTSLLLRCLHKQLSALGPNALNRNLDLPQHPRGSSQVVVILESRRGPATWTACSASYQEKTLFSSLSRTNSCRNPQEDSIPHARVDPICHL